MTQLTFTIHKNKEKQAEYINNFLKYKESIKRSLR